MGYQIVEAKYIDFIETVFRGIDRELRRLYWNKHQRELDSPFDNTGNSYSNDTFTVTAYDWSNEEDEQPNFVYKGLKIYWYKYLGRCMNGQCDVEVNPDYIYQMFQDCMASLLEDFKDTEVCDVWDEEDVEEE